MASDQEDASGVYANYRSLTPRSAEIMARAAMRMPVGMTRTFGFFEPYPVVFQRGAGSFLWDVDGNRYVDLVNNGLSLIHGHAYAPVEAALREVIGSGTAWPGASIPQIEFAELLVGRIPGAEQIRFTSTGTEATMLAVAVARSVTKRPLVLKARHAYHGASEDLLAGFNGRGEVPGRTVIAEFNDAAQFEAVLSEHGEQIAAVLIEPVLCSGLVTSPQSEFLPRVEQAARRSGAMFVIDDCLMFRLAPGGSAEKFGIRADITCLGKWIGGGLPVGAILARSEIMEPFLPALVTGGTTGAVHHGGSFNGNILGSVAGRIAVQDLTPTRIARMDEQAARLLTCLRQAAIEVGVPLRTSHEGSVIGLSVLDDDAQNPSPLRTSHLHLAALARGVYMSPGGLISMATSMSDSDLDLAISGLCVAISELAGSTAGASPSVKPGTDKATF